MESIGRDLREMQRIPLSDRHVTALREVAEVVTYQIGETLAYPSQPVDRFIYIEIGEVEVVNSYTDERWTAATLGPTQFVSEMGLLNGASWGLQLRATQLTRVLEVSRNDMLELMERLPELSDHVITVLIARRRRHVELRETALLLLGEEIDRDVRSISNFAIRNKIPYMTFPLGSSEARDAAQACGLAIDRPAVVFGKGVVVERPTPSQIALLLGMNRVYPQQKEFDLLIIGGGPAGVAAGVYAGAEGIKALVVEDTAIGGQAGTSSRVENYMGFPTGISGADLVWRGEVQAMKFGTQFVTPVRVERLEAVAQGWFVATFDNGQTVRARAVVIATGVQYRRLPIARLQQFEGSGVYYAATESEARYCSGAITVIVGGGNSAGQAAIFLRRICSEVHLVVRSGSLAASMSHYLSNRLGADPGITIHYHSQVTAVDGGATLQRVTLRNSTDDSVMTLPACALFIMVGAEANTAWLSDLVQLDDKGFIITGEAAGAHSAYATSCPGIFAVGDVRSSSIKRVAASVGEGSVVISKVWEYLNPSPLA